MRRKIKKSLKREKDKSGSRKQKTEINEEDTIHDSNEGESKNTNGAGAGTATQENSHLNNEEFTENKKEDIENSEKLHNVSIHDEGKANENEGSVENFNKPKDQVRHEKFVTPNIAKENDSGIDKKSDEIKNNESKIKQNTNDFVESAIELSKKDNVEEMLSEKQKSEDAVADETDVTKGMASKVQTEVKEKQAKQDNIEDIECSSLICEQENLRAIEAGVFDFVIEEDLIEEIDEETKLQEEKVEEEQEVYVEVPIDPAEPYNFSDSQEALKAPFELRLDQLVELEQLWESFQNCTPAYSDIDGYITEKELVFMLKALLIMTYTPEQLQELINFCVRPPDPEGRITFEQFVKMVTMRQRDFPVEEEVRAALKVMDTEDIGVIDREFMREVLHKQGNKMGPKMVDKLIKEVDIAGDGTINVEDVVGTMVIDLNRDDILLLRQTLFPDEAPTEIIIPDDPTATATDD
ncbi:uncharacterized protein LOC105397985 [Plutella xylostella]|uniref:uncharacterized protein LOC105397985 n=1 Tax=Plutella xylostella TaxID=51655 RepID=UPI00203281F4|nr:uncharacterized protein LOC105397985 [Plutella xylostella]